MTAESMADALTAATRGRPVTVETVGGFRAYGHSFELYEVHGEPVCVALTVDNGRLTVPWHAVNLIHAHAEDET